MSKIILIDGHSILHRAYFGIPDLTNSEGLHTNAVYGFLNIMFMIMEEEKPDYITVAFDLHGPTFRHEIFSEYKGTRSPMDSELREQVPLIQEVLKSMDIQVVTLPGYEADDLLGTMAKKCQSLGMDVSLVSGDRDLLQISDEHIKVRIPKTKAGRTQIFDYYPADVEAEFGVDPKTFIEMKAIMGDSSDNIKGIPGIGPKGACKLLQEYGSLDGIYEHIDDMKKSAQKEHLIEGRESAYLSLKLVTIVTDAPVDFDLEKAKITNIYTDKAYELFKRLEFKNFLSRFSDAGAAHKKAGDYEEAFNSITDFAEADALFNEYVKKAKLSTDIFPLAWYIPSEGKTDDTDIPFITIASDSNQIVTVMCGGFITPQYIMSRLKELAAIEKIRFILAGSKSQYKFINIPLVEDKCFDVYIAAYLLDPLRNDYTPEYLSSKYLGDMVRDRETLIGKNPDLIKMATEEPDRLSLYTSTIVYTSISTYGILRDRLENEGMLKLFEEIEMPLTRVLSSMERLGVRVRRETLDVYSEELGKRMEELSSQIYEEAGEQFNILSPKQLGTILFDKMHLPGGKKTKTGYSTSADVLEKLRYEPIVAMILEYRAVSKLKSTYADGLAPYIDENGRIHSTFHQTITATGRISSADPNLQNIPTRTELGRGLRAAFVPIDGYLFTDADYSQIELRILAHIAGDKSLIESYREGRDIHTITASKVFGTPIDQVTPLQRRNAKAVNFGIVYGISSFGLSQDLNISRKEAAEYIDQYFQTFPGIKTYLDSSVEKAKADGYVTTLYGRRRPIPELASSNFMQRQFGERVAMNSPIQGTAADIMKIAMIGVYRQLEERKLKSHIVLQIHDELLIETAPDEVDIVSNILTEQMMHAADLQVNLEIDMHTGADWLEAH